MVMFFVCLVPAKDLFIVKQDKINDNDILQQPL